MTSPSRKKHRITRPSTPRGTTAEAAATYRAVDAATRSRREPLWLPAGWLAAVLALTLAASQPAAGQTDDGWRPRGAAHSRPHSATAGRGLFPSRIASAPKAQPSAVRQVAWQDDLAGPSLPVAQREGVQHVAADTLRDSFERPFGEGADLPGRSTPADPADADQLFDDLPAEPDALPEPESIPSPDPIGDTRSSRPGDFLFGDDDDDNDRNRDRDDEDAVEDITPPSDDEDDDTRAGADDDRRDAADARRDQEKLAKERMQSSQDCSEALAELKARRLDAIDLSIRVTGDEGKDYPYLCRLDDGSVFAPRCWGEVTYMWKASGLCHKPLYFEDVQLERYGHSWGPLVQPLVSGAHFFGRLPVLPYMMGIQTPDECVYTLGHYRPGDCAPYMIDPVPFTWRAALFQTGATFGVIGILP